MKKLMITAAALLVAVSAFGQGQFLFNTRNTSTGNVLTFVDSGGNKIAGADYFVEVLAGADANSLKPVTGNSGVPLVINRLTSTGVATGFTNPFSDIFTVPGIGAGKTAVVGYRAYQGTSWDTATVKSGIQTATSAVTLTEPPTPPNEVALGTQTVNLVPEPATWALGLIGLGSLLAIRRRK